ncbi:MAG: amidohydrolase family protein [Luteitalea sp.]|nr:amidohydrolase family protein [Luteitalea sp.]
MMSAVMRRAVVVAAAFAVMAATACDRGRGDAATSESEGAPDIVLREYEPRSMLVTKETKVPRARYPAIDNHNHLRNTDPAEAIAVMDQTGVAQVVNLDGGFGEDLVRNIERFDKQYPGRFLTYARPDWSKIAEPGFGEQAAAELEAGVRAGARGLKIHKGLGLELTDAKGQLIAVDDPRLDPLWAKAGELGIPIEIHIGDPAAFFTPLDRFNERFDELQRRPEWLFYPDYPSLEEIVRQGERVVARHPKTIFIGAHMGWYAENLEVVGAMLDKYPNYYIDIDARLSELGRQPYTARRFLIKYQDRVLFGTDTAPRANAYQLYWRFLETDDEYFDIAESHHRQGRWMVHGLYLPDEALKKLYYENALKLIPGASIEAATQ